MIGKKSCVHVCSYSFHLAIFPDPCCFVGFQSSSNNVQDIIESRVEKRTKGVYVPIGSKKLITFMDDFNMPAKDTFGSQPPLELMRLWLDYGFWYDRQKQTVKKIQVSRGSSPMMSECWKGKSPFLCCPCTETWLYIYNIVIYNHRDCLQMSLQCYLSARHSVF